MLVFEEKGAGGGGVGTEYPGPGENFSEQRREPMQQQTQPTSGVDAGF